MLMQCVTQVDILEKFLQEEKYLNLDQMRNYEEELFQRVGSF